MSRLRANQITNENANGAPNFPHGLTVTGVVTATSAPQTMTSIVVGSAVTANSQGIDVTGVVTATSFKGDGSNLTGLNVDSTALKDSGGSVKAQANSTGVVVTGITTSDNIKVGAAGSITTNKIFNTEFHHARYGAENSNYNRTAGGIVQISQNGTNDREATNSTTFQPTNLSAKIKPSSATNRVVVIVSGDANNNGNGHYLYLTVRRQINNTGGFTGPHSGGLPIIGANDTGGTNSNRGFVEIYSSSRVHVGVNIHHIDTPNTTDEIEYKVFFRSNNSGQTVEYPVNELSNPCYLTLYEVTGS